MSPDSQANVNSLAATAQKTGSQLQSQYNNQAAQQYNTYKGNETQANSAYNNLANYNKSMADPAQLYSQYLTQGEQAQGFNPQQLAGATQGLTQEENALSGINNAAQSSTGGYGLSGTQLGNYYASQTQPLQTAISSQNNAVNNYQQLYQNAMTQANQQASLGYQGEQLKSQNYQSLYTTAVSQMQTSGQTLSAIEALQQQQGYLTSEQVSNYQNAYNNYVSAQAAAEQASANMISAQANASLANSQTQQQQMQNKQTGAYMNSQAYQNYLKYGSTSAPKAKSSNSSSSGSSSKFNLGDFLKTATDKIV